MNQLFLFRKNMTPIRKLLLMKMFAGGVPISEYTATGNPLTFNTNVAKPLKSLLIPWTPVQSGTGDPSPENVRPISGVSALTVSHSGQDTSNPTTYPIVFPALGKNLFDKSKVTTGVWWKGKVLTGGTYDDYSASDYIPVTAGQTYTLTRDVSGQGAVCYFDSEKTYVSQETWDQYTPSHQIPADIAYITFTTLTTGLDTAQFEQGSSATSYEPYTNTVYGGSLDVVSGVLTAEWKAIDMGSVNYSLYTTTASRQTYYLELSGLLYPNDNTKTLDALSSVFKQVSQSGVWSAYSMSCGKVGGQNVVVVSFAPETYADGDAVKVALTGETFCYKLAEPQTYQLTPQQITAILGDNTIWSDTNGTNTAIYFKKG